MTTKTKFDEKKVPKLRFPDFSGDWTRERMKGLFTITAGGDIGKIKFSKNETDVLKTPVYSNTLKGEGLYGYTDVSLEIAPSLTVTARGNIGHANARMTPYCSVVRLLVLTPKKDIDVKFFEAGINKLNIFIESTGVPQLTAPQLSKYSINLPTLPEQQKIADFLTTVDSWVQTLESQKKNLEIYKKGIIQKIFSQEIRFEDEDGNEFPDWEEKKLGEVGEFKRGKGISKSDIESDGKNKCVRYGEIYTEYNEVIQAIKSRTNIEKDQSVLSFKNDVLIPSSGETPIDIATASCITESNIILGGDLNIIRPKQRYSGVYLAYIISNCEKRRVARMAQGNSVVHLYNSHLKNLWINIPTLPEQQTIVDFLSSIDELIQSKQTQINKAKEWKKGLMQQLYI
jgi:type I restriction enzyme, S subunit